MTTTRHREALQVIQAPIPSPALFDRIGQRFRAAVATFAWTNHVPVVRFRKGDRKIDVMRPHVEAQASTGRSGVAAIGVAQEFQSVFTGSARPTRRTSWRSGGV